MKHACLVILSMVFSCSFYGQDFTVTTTGDAGPGSLRGAISSCNAAPSVSHKISFRIPASDPGYDAVRGTWTIRPVASLPSIMAGNITIDATTQTSFAGNTNPLGPEIVLDGNNNQTETGFVLYNCSGTVIRGFAVSGFLYGIQVFGQGSHDNVIAGNYIGSNETGISGKGNYNGIELLSGAWHNLIGGSTPADRNIISGNLYAGLRMADANRNIITGNYVGIDRTGSAAVPNYDGITAEGNAWGNRIGGTTIAERNIASGNSAYGIDIFGAGCTGNTILGNFVGTDKSGSFAIPNTYGVLFDDRSNNNIIGGSTPGSGNLISGNTAFGAYFYNNGTNTNYLLGNLVGTDITGTLAIPNETGVWIDGAAYGNMVDSNVVSGNSGYGITIVATFTKYNIITRNLIGTDITGQHPLGNGLDGILIAMGPSSNLVGGSVRDANTIAWNRKSGVAVESDKSLYNRISCNRIYGNALMGIDLFPEGITLNDPGNLAGGPNGGQNYPVITGRTALPGTGKIVLSGFIDTWDPGQVAIEVFLTGSGSSGIAQGRELAGQTRANASGTWIDTVSVNLTDSLICTATRLVATPGYSYGTFGNTSEFTPMVFMTAIDDHAGNGSMVIYPNPVSLSGYTNILFNKQVTGTLELSDNLGKSWLQKHVENSDREVIPVRNLVRGVYYLRFVPGNGDPVAVVKLLVR